MEKTETKTIKVLSKLLKYQEDLLERCDELNPWSSSPEDREMFRDACLYGGLAIVRLNQIDRAIIPDSQRLKPLAKLELDGVTNLSRYEQFHKCVRLWGQALEINDGLKDAVEFCCSLADKKKKSFGDENYRVEFKEHSQQLAGALFYDLLDILAAYEPAKYPNLRLQIICSYLRGFRESFIWNATVRGPCRSDRIPDECKPQKPPANLKGEALVRLGNKQHEFSFFTSSGSFEWLINNTGLKNYKALLDEVWDVSTGQLHFYPADGSAVWIVQNREHIEMLNDDADRICNLLRPLSQIEMYKELAKKVEAIVTNGRSRWTVQTDIRWSFLEELDLVIADLDKKPKQYELKTQEQTPAETGGNAEGSKIMRTSRENWEAIEEEYDISKKDFGKKINFVSDLFKRSIIFRDVEHAFVLASEGYSKPALILAGGVIEELLRLYLGHKKIKPKNRFVDYIQACEHKGLLKRGVSRLSDSIRDFRNLVHLENEETKRHTVSKATAKGAVSSIFTIANDFQ